MGRATAHSAKGALEMAITDYGTAIRLDPKYAEAYVGRGDAYKTGAFWDKANLDRAIADYSEAIRLKPKSFAVYNKRGSAYETKGDVDRAIAEYSEAIRLDPKYSPAYASRGNTYRAKGDMERAIEDYRAFLALPPSSATDQSLQQSVQEWLAKLMQSQPTPVAVPGRRVALVIGNSKYSQVSILRNPANDARAVGAAFRRLGFTEVKELHDLNRAAMSQALKEFGDQATIAEWAVVYFAGHGLEMEGITYLVPTDAKLERDLHVKYEALALPEVLLTVEGAGKLGLIILDACRDNPFVSRMVRSTAATRSASRGLAPPIEPAKNVLVVYAAKQGTVADDGTAGANSPFAEALVANLDKRGLEINLVFREVRDQVLERTRRRQEPYVYGTLGRELLYFAR
jgi:tetratricopeptide (TPR) repeat protein